MPSARQIELAKEIIANIKRPAREKKNKKELVVSSGYTVAQAKKKQTEIINSDGVQIALKGQGFTEENAKAVMEEIMLDKKVSPKYRIQAGQEVFKVFGTYAPEKSVGLSGTLEELLEYNLGKRNETGNNNNPGDSKVD